MNRGAIVIICVSIVVLVGICAAFLFLPTLPSLPNSANESSCSSLTGDDLQRCCANEYGSNIPYIMCEGSWSFNSSSLECNYICSSSTSPNVSKPESPIFCAADVFACSDGSFVARDPRNGCKFKPCP